MQPRSWLKVCLLFFLNIIDNFLFDFWLVSKQLLLRNQAIKAGAFTHIVALNELNLTHWNLQATREVNGISIVGTYDELSNRQQHKRPAILFLSCFKAFDDDKKRCAKYAHKGLIIALLA